MHSVSWRRCCLLDVCKDLVQSDRFHEESSAVREVEDVSDGSDGMDSMEQDETIQCTRN